MSPRGVKGERRQKSRKCPPSLVYVELGTENGGMLRDLSEEGFALRTMMPVRAGDKTPFSIVLTASVRIEGQGEVLWIEENGRVAGLRFLDISSQAMPQIQGWLNGTLETLEAKSDPNPEQLAHSQPQSFDQLRQELHSPSAKVELPQSHRGEQSVPQQQVTSIEPPPSSEAKSPKELPVEIPPAEIAPSELPLAEAQSPAFVKGTKASEQVPELAPQPPTDPQSLPGLPDFSATQQAIEITFEALPPAPAPVPERFPRIKSAQSSNTREETPELNANALPEISKILIQPPGIEREFALNSSTLEPLEAAPQSLVKSAPTWMEWFTLSRVVTIMIALALLVTLSAFHRALGQGLIWLGEAMGGSQSIQPQPDATEVSPNSQLNSPGPDPSQQPIGTPATQENAKPESKRTPLQQIPASEATRSAQPLVPPSVSETGLSEYSKALQLLHGKKGGEDTSEAVRLLWDSVGKGNTSAELTLAELYWHGEGIEHNCDQARSLLGVAARKGNFDAQKLLKKFDQEGCK
jgi:hypothetical protein